MSGSSRSSTMQSKCSRPSASSASAPVATATVLTSPLPTSSMMLWRWTSSSSTTSSFFTRRSTNSRMRVEDPGQRVLVRGLGLEAQGALLQRALRLVRHRDHVDRDVAGRGVVLQPLQHAPAVDVGQADVQGDGARLQLAGQGQGGRAARGHQGLEALLVGELVEVAGEGEVVLHHQHHAVAGGDAVAVVHELVEVAGRLLGPRPPGTGAARGPGARTGAAGRRARRGGRSALRARGDLRAVARRAWTGA